MKRQVFLVKGLHMSASELSNFEAYINSYQLFFKSNAGGAYEDNEIAVLDQPTVVELKKLVDDAAIDYAITVLVGHGGVQDNIQLYQINSTEIIKPGQLEFIDSKHLIILESCRNIGKGITAIDITDRVPRFKSGGVILIALTRAKVKALYIEQIDKCDKGIVVCFACSKDESANGYYFSKILLEKAKAWSSSVQNKSSVLSINTLMASVSTEVAQTLKQQCNEVQIPEIVGNLDFPFAVSRF